MPSVCRLLSVGVDDARVRPSRLEFQDDWNVCGGGHWSLWVIPKEQGRHHLPFYWLFQHTVELGVLLSSPIKRLSLGPKLWCVGG